MKLYYSPGACSIGIHFLLEEIGTPYEIERIDLRSGAQFSPEFVKVNPKSKVPALLRDDGSLLTEYPAIALWLARSNPGRNLIPTDIEGEARVQELISYVTATLHMQGFARMFKPEKFAPSESDLEAVRNAGRAIIDAGLAHLSRDLGDRQLFIGDHLTIADSAVFYVLFWLIGRMKLEVPANLQAYYDRLLTRATVQKVFADEGIPLN